MKKYPIFVFLFLIYPSLALLAWNLREVDANIAIRPLIFSIMLGCSFFLISLLLIRHLAKAILISTVFIIFFFSFGHIALFIKETGFATAFGKTREAITIILFLTSLLGVFLLCHAILKTKRDLSQVYSVLNVISIFLVLSSGWMLLAGYLTRLTGSEHPQTEGPDQKSTGPDVYYIILDAYGRQDALNFLGYDNSTFIQELEEIGFYVASCGRSNYPQTVMSMASALNMGYIWEVIPNQGANDRNSTPVYAGILHSQVRQGFEDRGYRIVAFESGAGWLHWRDADQFVTPPSEPFFSTHLDPFEYIFLDTTALHTLMTQPFFLRNKYIHHYNRIRFTLDDLPKIARSAGPKFVYIHMLIPHRPNIFMPDGSMNLDTNYYKKGAGEGINRRYDIEGYLNNTKFINSRLPDVIREIIRNSQTTPVIIIQGDHGYQLPAIRFDILNAYYFPDQNYEALYPEITPVNTFRVVFNTYFNEDYPLVKDQSIDVGINRPYGKKTMKLTPCP